MSWASPGAITLRRSIFNYPPAAASPPTAGPWGVGEHTDYGLLTILKQDEVGGLQVRHGERWLDVPDLPNSFVCNVGDALERVTGGRHVSAPHRVINGSGRARLSMPFFFDPAFQAPMASIAGLQPRRRPRPAAERWDATELASVHGTYGEYLLGKVSRVFPDLASRHQLGR